MRSKPTRSSPFSVVRVVLAGAAFATSGAAATLDVDPSDSRAFRSLHDALRAAEEGDTVRLAAGEHVLRATARVTVSVRIEGAGTPEETALRLEASDPDAGSLLSFAEDIDPDRTVVESLTLAGGRGTEGRGGAVLVERASPRFVNCRFRDNIASEGGAVWAAEGAPRFERCVFEANRAGSAGGAVLCAEGSFAEFSFCRFEGNEAPLGGAVSVRDSARPRFLSCEFEANRARDGGGIHAAGSSSPFIFSSLFAGNRATSGGGLLATDNSGPRVVHCTAAGNSTSSGDGTIAAYSGSTPEIFYSIVWGNDGGTIGSHDDSRPVVFEVNSEDEQVRSNPRFVAPGRWDDRGSADTGDDVWIAGDYRLRPDSQLIDRGGRRRDIDLGDDALDLDGNQRRCWHEPDLGAYEFCGVPASRVADVVFAARQFDSLPSSERVDAVEHARRGRLIFRDAGTGELETLVDAESAGVLPFTPTDVADPDVSSSGLTVVFSGFHPLEKGWRIFEYDLGRRSLRQVTRTEQPPDLSRYGEAAESFAGHDDLDPCYLPDGRICFVSTRYRGSAPDGRMRATNLYIVRADGTDLRRITSERFGADTPVVDPQTGRIIFSRWWRSPEVRGGIGVVHPDLPPEGGSGPPPPPAVPPGSPDYDAGENVPAPSGPTPEPGVLPPPSRYRPEVFAGIPDSQFPGVNSWFLATIRPDGTDQRMFTGVHLDRQATQAHHPAMIERDVLVALALFATETPILGRPGVFGLREIREGLERPVAIGGPQTFAADDGELEVPFLYASAAPQARGDYVVSAVPVGSRSNPGSYGIYLQEHDTSAGIKIHPVLDDPDWAELDPVPVESRRPVPVLPGPGGERPLPDLAPRDAAEAFEEGGSFLFHARNLFANGPVDSLQPNAPPLGERLEIEFYMLPQRTSFVAADPAILIRREIVPPDGEVRVELPAGVPLFEVLRRPDGTIATGRDGQIFHVAGANYGVGSRTQECVGCHAGHSRLAVAADPEFTNLAPSATVAASSALELGPARLEPHLLVDRRTDFIRSEWAADPTDGAAKLTLEWAVPIVARQFVLYGPLSGRGVFGPRQDGRLDAAITASLDGRLVSRLDLFVAPRRTGTTIPWGSELAFDRLEIELEVLSGLFEGHAVAALAEIEVIGKAAPGAELVAGSFVRGETNCDGRVDLSDAVTLLRGLFLNDRLCCRAAADTDANGRVELVDALVVLNHLFRSGAPPSAPFPECAAGGGSLPCESPCER